MENSYRALDYPIESVRLITFNQETATYTMYTGQVWRSTEVSMELANAMISQGSKDATVSITNEDGYTHYSFESNNYYEALAPEAFEKTKTDKEVADFWSSRRPLKPSERFSGYIPRSTYQFRRGGE